MSQITSYSTLRDQVTAHMMRGADTDFIAEVPTLIQLAEARLKRDKRVRQTWIIDPVAISAERLTLPTDFKTLTSFALTGPTYFGPLNQVSMNELENLKSTQGDAAGVPSHFALDGGFIYVHKVPGETYSGRLVYERTIVNLSDSVTSNWLLASHPDIYLYSALLEAAPYLKDDERIAVWETFREQRLEELHEQRQEAALSSQSDPSNGIVFGG